MAKDAHGTKRVDIPSMQLTAPGTLALRSPQGWLGSVQKHLGGFVAR